MAERKPKTGRETKDTDGERFETTAVRLHPSMLETIRERKQELQKRVREGILISVSDVMRGLIESALKGEIIELEPELRTQIEEFRRKLQGEIPADLSITITFGQALGALVKKGLKTENKKMK